MWSGGKNNDSCGKSLFVLQQDRFSVLCFLRFRHMNLNWDKRRKQRWEKKIKFPQLHLQQHHHHRFKGKATNWLTSVQRAAWVIPAVVHFEISQHLGQIFPFKLRTLPVLWPLLWLFTACRGDSSWLWSLALVRVSDCFIYSAEPRCRCAGLFHGARCELAENPCASQPCANGRVCVPKAQGYLCNCSLDTTGEW